MTVGQVTEYVDGPVEFADLIEALHTHPGRCEACDRVAHVHDDGVCTRCHRAGALFATAWAHDLLEANIDDVAKIIGAPDG